MNDFDLRSLQMVELDILLEVDRICRKHNIRYFLIAGTLLGAIRHKGFIPWDDDIDICMPIDDYRKFCKIARTEMNSNYFLQNHNTDNTTMWFCKIRKNNTTMIEKGLGDSNIHHGVWIDIFPIIGIINNKEWLVKCNRKANIAKTILQKRRANGKYSDLSKDKKLLRLFPLSFLLWTVNLIYKNIFKNHDRYEYCYYLWGAPTIKPRFKSDLFRELCEVEFEGHMFFAPKKWDEYLTILYGDYMTPPPVTQRGNGSCHSISILDLENDYSKYVGKI